MRKNPFVIIGGIFGLLGVILLAVAIVWTATTASFLAGAERTEGTVTELIERISTNRDSDGFSRESRTWRPVVEFNAADGTHHSFESSTGSSPPAYGVGDSVPVAYDPDNPSDARIATFWSAYLGPVIFGGMGAIFTPLGGLLFFRGWRKRKVRSWLRRHGRELWVEVAHTHVERATNVRVNGRYPFVIRAAWVDPLTAHTYTASSEYLWHNPAPALETQSHVRVLFDPGDPQRNLIDLDSHPNLFR